MVCIDLSSPSVTTTGPFSSWSLGIFLGEWLRGKRATALTGLADLIPAHSTSYSIQGLYLVSRGAATKNGRISLHRGEWLSGENAACWMCPIQILHLVLSSRPVHGETGWMKDTFFLPRPMDAWTGS